MTTNGCLVTVQINNIIKYYIKKEETKMVVMCPCGCGRIIACKG